MRITVNGEERQLEAGATVAELLAALALKSELVAVEQNAAIVPRREHAATEIKEGDRFEIVTLVGGG